MITEVRKNMKVKVISGKCFQGAIGKVAAANLEKECVVVMLSGVPMTFTFEQVEEVEKFDEQLGEEKININIANFKNGFVLTKNIKAVIMEQQHERTDLYLVTILHKNQETCIYDLALEDARKIVQDIQNTVSRFYDEK